MGRYTPTLGQYYRLADDLTVIVRVEEGPSPADPDVVTVRPWTSDMVVWEGDYPRLPDAEPEDLIPCPVDALCEVPVMTSAKGIPMSRRLERLWRYLSHERKIAISNFSTDNTVQGCWRELEQALADARRYREEAEGRTQATVPVWGPAAGYPVGWLDHLIEDIQSVMRRTPANRVGAAPRRAK